MYSTGQLWLDRLMFAWQIAIYGKNFCVSAKNAFMLLMRNVIRFVTGSPKPDITIILLYVHVLFFKSATEGPWWSTKWLTCCSSSGSSWSSEEWVCVCCCCCFHQYTDTDTAGSYQDTNDNDLFPAVLSFFFFSGRIPVPGSSFRSETLNYYWMPIIVRNLTFRWSRSR